MSTIQSFSDVIDLWPTAADFGRDIGVSDISGRAMRTRDSIPSKYWVTVVEKAKERGNKITYETLAKLASEESTQ